MTRIALHGAGRMSAAIMRAAAQDPAIEVIAVVAPHAPEWGETNRYYPTLDQLSELPDVLIDFSLPDGTVAAAQWCSRSGIALLSGVTGLHQAASDGLSSAAQATPVLWSPNLSLGVNLLAALCRQAAARLKPDTPVIIEDIHHQWKKDTPSGTALMLGAAIDAERPPGAPGPEYQSVRQGEVIGRHSVTFQWAGEQIVLGHEALDRDAFARGALAAAHWLAGKPAGMYTAADWLAT